MIWEVIGKVTVGFIVVVSLLAFFCWLADHLEQVKIYGKNLGLQAKIDKLEAELATLRQGVPYRAPSPPESDRGDQ